MLLILLLALFTSCRSGDSQATEQMGIEGLWTLNRVERLGGEVYDYPNSSGTFLLLVDGDSVMYVCHWAHHAKGNVLLPTCRMTYTLIDKGGGENVFLLNGKPRPLQMMGDTAFCFSYYSETIVWQRERSLPEATVADITALLTGETYEEGKQYDHYFFTPREYELESKANRLGIFVAILALCALMLVCVIVRSHVRRRRVEQQLRAMEEERELRPQQVSTALQTVEDAFLGSDEYVRLYHRLTSGRHMSDKEWEEVSRQLNGVYPGFTRQLFSLYPMSDVERKICMLIKLRVPASDIATLLNKEKSSISTARSRLYAKIFGKKGSAKDWDEFVLSL